jgi:hypothetical protein
MILPGLSLCLVVDNNVFLVVLLGVRCYKIAMILNQTHILKIGPLACTVSYAAIKRLQCIGISHP